jgi:hypothetical protein
VSTPTADVLKISPKYTAHHWFALNKDSRQDWPKAAAIIEDRIRGRFLRYADQCLTSLYSGFVVLAIDSLLLETIQQFKQGVIKEREVPSSTLVKSFLGGEHFRPDFDDVARESFYKDIRCGLLHQAEAKKLWLIRRGRKTLLEKVGGGYVLDVVRFHHALTASFNDYLTTLVDEGEYGALLRDNLWKKMKSIADVRVLRGAMPVD